MKPKISKIMALSMQDIHDLLSALDLAQIRLINVIPLAYQDHPLGIRWRNLEGRLREQMRSDPKIWKKHA